MLAIHRAVGRGGGQREEEVGDKYYVGNTQGPRRGRGERERDRGAEVWVGDLYYVDNTQGSGRGGETEGRRCGWGDPYYIGKTQGSGRGVEGGTGQRWGMGESYTMLAIHRLLEGR